jgi:hypothetical protein
MQLGERVILVIFTDNFACQETMIHLHALNAGETMYDFEML